MEFLDQETEAILKQCVDNESTYPQILRDMFKQCNSSLEDKHLRARISTLIKGEYLSKITWGDDLPIFGRIEPKGLEYFKRKHIYVRAMLRKHPTFSLSSESEECLKKIIAIQSNAPYITVNRNVGSVSAVQDLANQGFIQLKKEISPDLLTGGFSVLAILLPKGKNYFQDKADYIEEILAFPSDVNLTEINITNGDNSPLQINAVNSSQNVEYNFDEAQEALSELLSKIDELGLKLDQKQEILENIEEAQKLAKEKKKGPLKTILKGIVDVLKDVGCSILSSLIISKMNL